MEEEESAEPAQPKRKKKRDKGKKYELYEVRNGEVNRLKKTCPRCGPGIFMADHGERLACGKCGYTEFKNTK
ncbi:30S ribosomal protein S27 [candidate division MSBL1 archaeon SCGC-AAA259A05]|uniref:Small ribosomal subunit protein eS31 n=1 Tax=candidate division MSBL1 archaeon SCGC-AAA259A05 TaxID=1698259 RepID=A0A133U9N7_9EURY|nr:30S ribosomal protein S27 [candidate division MSBL1 archaeon SCGC-AAA259A05]